jgi:hypothetical protein
MPSSLRSVLMKQSALVPLWDVHQYVEKVHQTRVVGALFDHQHYVWQYSDRQSAAGIILIEADFTKEAPLPYPEPRLDDGSDDALLLNVSTAKRHPMFLLEYLAGTKALIDQSGAPGVGSATAGHVQPLLAAPDWLLRGPSHCAYPMEPTVWVPFALTDNIQYFATPYHKGLFNGRSPSYGSSTPKPPEERPSALAHASAFDGMVHVGSVVSYRKLDESEGQGIVLLTYVRMSISGNAHVLQAAAGGTENKFLRAMLSSPQPIDTTLHHCIDNAQPIPEMLVLQLKNSSADAAHGSQCWQEVIFEATIVRADEITQIWQANQLGALGAPNKAATAAASSADEQSPPAQLMHRTSPELTPKPLSNPAAPSRLREALLSSQAKQIALDFLCNAVKAGKRTVLSPSQFLSHLRSRASLNFPIDTLLNGRARINSFQPLAEPGIVKKRLQESASAAASSNAMPPPAPHPASKQPQHAQRPKPIQQLEDPAITQQRAQKNSQLIQMGKGDAVQTTRSAFGGLMDLSGEQEEGTGHRSQRQAKIRAGENIGKMFEDEAPSAAAAMPVSGGRKRKSTDSAAVQDVAAKSPIRSSTRKRKSGAAAASAEETAVDETVQVAFNPAETSARSASEFQLLSILCDVTASEHFAPLAAQLWACIEKDAVQNRKAVPTGEALNKAVIEWVKEFYTHIAAADQKESTDPVFYHFLSRHAVADPN